MVVVNYKAQTSKDEDPPTRAPGIEGVLKDQKKRNDPPMRSYIMDFYFLLNDDTDGLIARIWIWRSINYSNPSFQLN